MANLIVFVILAVIIVSAAIASVLTKRIMRAVTALLFVLFGVAGMYFLMDYTFLGAAQLSIYAGALTMMYIFAIAMVNKRSLQGSEESFEWKRVTSGVVTATVGLLVTLIIFFKNGCLWNTVGGQDVEVPMEQIGTALLGSEKYQYVLPFEFISVFLLACIIGGLVVSRKNKEDE